LAPNQHQGAGHRLISGKNRANRYFVGKTSGIRPLLILSDPALPPHLSGSQCEHRMARKGRDMMTRFTIIGLLFTAVPTIALADPRTATVTVTRADMASPTARAQLDRRIGAAIEQVCGSYAAIENSQVPEMDSCWEAAKAQVAQRIASIKDRTEIRLASH
jgi:UrcA family protein